MAGKVRGSKKSASDGHPPNVDLTRSFADSLSEDDIKADGLLTHAAESPSHDSILERLLNQVASVDFRSKANLSKEEDRVKRKHHLILVIEEILRLAQVNKWGLCNFQGAIHVYNGQFWSKLAKEEFQAFLGEAAEKMGVDPFDAKYFEFREPLFKQFLTLSHLKEPPAVANRVLINLRNGTLEIAAGQPQLRPSDQKDFLTYQLPFDFDQAASYPKFKSFLNEVLPDKECQMVLQEYLGYVFVNSSMLKLEKVLLIYGTGANGKSVLFEIVNALLGGERNVSNFSLQNLTDSNGYYRASIGNKLLNYASEINHKMEADIFKRLASGEPVEARLPYGPPLTITNYAKLMFNCNELPKEVEQSHAFFRRFLILPFTVQIPEERQDKVLSRTIIQNELSGILNWVLEGLERLLEQKAFTISTIVSQQIAAFKKESDSLQLFLEDEGYVKSIEVFTHLKVLYPKYHEYCLNFGFYPCSMQTLGKRLRNLGHTISRKKNGYVVMLEKIKVVSEGSFGSSASSE